MESTATDTKTFSFQIKDGVAHLRFCRADKANSMNRDFWKEFPEAINRCNANPEARVLVISGEGKNFCSGMDLSVFSDSKLIGNAQARNREGLRGLVLELQSCFSVLQQLRIPVIAAIQGACIGAGLDLIAACDIRYSTRDAYFCIHEINLAMMADLGSLQRLPGLLPEGIVRELAFTGDKLKAQDAERYGLLNAVFEDESAMLEYALQKAQKIASRSPVAIAASKQCLNYNRAHSVADSLEYCANVQAGVLDLADLAEAAKAQAAKTEVTFADRQSVPTLR